MKLSANGELSLKTDEGLKLTPYQCSADVWTIGWGHTRNVTKHGVVINGKLYAEITKEQAHDLFLEDAMQFELAVRRLVKVPLTQNQFDALVSFTYNLGGGALKGKKDKKTGKIKPSTLLAKLNAKDYAGAAKEFNKWIYEDDGKGGKRKSKGLINRRKAERELFENDNNPTIFKRLYHADSNNTPLRNRDLPLPTIMQAGLEGSDKRGVQTSEIAIGAGVVGAGSIATIASDPQIITPVLSFMQTVDWRVAIAVLVVGIVAVLWIRGRK